MNYTDSNEVKGCHVNTTVLEFSEKFKCTANDFYGVMTRKKVRVKQRDPSLWVQTRPKLLDFSGRKILSTPSFGGEVKPSVPCRRFMACKRSLNVT